MIDGLGDVAGDYDALLCDAWGVVHNGRRVFDGVAEALTRFRAERGPVVILTNAPKPSRVIPGQLDRLGLPRGAYDAVVTSGDVTRAAIAERLPQPAYAIGWRSDEALYAGLDVRLTRLEEAGFVVCTGLEEDGPQDPEAYRPRLAEAADRGLTMVCANPDIVVRWGDKLLWCAGALARIYEELGGAVVYAGKPHAPIYALAFAALEEAAGAPVPRDRALAIGDGLRTDIEGANRAGVDAVFIAGVGGIHDGGIDAGAIAAALDEAGVRARAAATGLVW
ncbi:MAG: TIGR01459 family HAD-type hydrolase [Parvularculaceae bacterium]